MAGSGAGSSAEWWWVVLGRSERTSRRGRRTGRGLGRATRARRMPCEQAQALSCQEKAASSGGRLCRCNRLLLLLVVVAGREEHCCRGAAHSSARAASTPPPARTAMLSTASVSGPGGLCASQSGSPWTWPHVSQAGKRRRSSVHASQPLKAAAACPGSLRAFERPNGGCRTAENSEGRGDDTGGRSDSSSLLLVQDQDERPQVAGGAVGGATRTTHQREEALVQPLRGVGEGSRERRSRLVELHRRRPEDVAGGAPAALLPESAPGRQARLTPRVEKRVR